jgi:hypothetical protein
MKTIKNRHCVPREARRGNPEPNLQTSETMTA